MRRGDIQGLRAIAIISVVAFHADIGVTGGFAGVDVFFAISGFVITTTLIRELERTGSLSLSGFYVRRVRRLLPGLATMLTLVSLAGILLTPVAASHISAVTGIAAALFGANVYLGSLPNGYFSVSSTLDPLLHTWTLGVEEQFYLVYPVVLLLAWRFGRRRTGTIAAVAVLSAVSLGFALHSSAGNSGFTFYASPARAWEFGAGALTALLVPWWRRVPRLVWTAFAAAAFAGLLVTSLGSGATPFAFRLGLPVAAACVLLAAGSRENLVSQGLSVAPLRAVGDLSYSWYLWHWPLIVFARALFPSSSGVAAAAAVASMLPAWLSWRFVENPIRFDRSLAGRRAIALAAACVAVPVVAAGAALAVRLPAAAAAYAPAMHADLERGCDDPYPLGSASRPNCTWRVAHPDGTVVLIGDSNAGHYTEGVVAAARRAHMDTVVATQSACPFVQLQVPQSICMQFNRQSLSWLRVHRPNLVIIGSRSDVWIERRSNQLGPPGGQLTSSTQRKMQLWIAGLRAEISQLTRVGVPVVVVHPVPVISLAAGGCAAVLTFLDRGCSGTVSRSTVDRELARTLVAEQDAVEGLDARVLDLEPELCTTEQCSSTRSGVPMYRDRYHLSVVGAISLEPVFYRTIRSAART